MHILQMTQRPKYSVCQQDGKAAVGCHPGRVPGGLFLDGGQMGVWICPALGLTVGVDLGCLSLNW